MNGSYRVPLIEPYPYQLEGAKWIAARKESLLSDSPGLGKSSQAIRACDLIGARNILTVAPASVRPNWGREFERFSPLDRPMQVCMPGEVPRTSGVVIVSYDMMTAHAEKLRNARWDALIIDECHLAKSRTARRTKALYGHGKRFPGIIASVDRTIRLSGTPAPGNASELWTHLRSAGLADEDFWTFTFRYTTGYETSYGYQPTGHKNVEELKQRLAPFMLRRTKEEVLTDLPELFFQTITVARSDAALLPEFTDQIPALKQQDAELEAALAAMDADRQISLLESTASSIASLRRYVLMSKLPAIAEQLADDLNNGLKKIVIFGIHRVGIEWMAERLRSYGAVVLYGGTSATDRQKNIDRFRTDPSCRVLVANITAGGTGVDGMQENCNDLCFLECSFVPGENSQAVMRLHRLRQKNSVRVRIFSLEGSVDEHVTETLARKTKELSKIF